MKTILIIGLLVATAAVTAILLWQVLGFRTQRPEAYSTTAPALDLATHLNGKLVAEGAIFGPTGRVNSRFVAEMEGSWTEQGGTLKETFFHSETGNVQDREWTFSIKENGTFTGTAPDIVGIAEGQVSGASARLNYRLRLPESAGGHVLHVTDWMYLAENGNIINRSEMRKFGLKVAELVASIRPKED